VRIVNGGEVVKVKAVGRLWNRHGSNLRTGREGGHVKMGRLTITGSLARDGEATPCMEVMGTVEAIGVDVDGSMGGVSSPKQERGGMPAMDTEGRCYGQRKERGNREREKGSLGIRL